MNLQTVKRKLKDISKLSLIYSDCYREWALLSKVRGQDVQLMKALNVSLICDLMVEKKKLKYGV